MKIYSLFATAIAMLCITTALGQKQSQNWYFGFNAGLSFSTSPPTVLTNGKIYNNEGCSSISDNQGNLLFYTGGDTIYNKLHAVMSNGTGLAGHKSTSQSALIVKQPGNTDIYFVFTQDAQSGPNGFRYSVIDMSLAGGSGSVTSKNIPLYYPSTEKIAATRHCNGTDVWVVTHDFNSDVFRAYLVSSAGVSANPVLSAAGSTLTGININTLGCMKISQNGKKLAMGTQTTFELFDFDPSSGIVSNAVFLGSYNSAYGVEFSPDGTRLYGGGLSQARLFQWDLCAGNGAAIAASLYTVSVVTGALAGMQLAGDGKIYIARFYKQDLAVINNPNLYGAACGFTDTGQSLGTKYSSFGLPNYIGGDLRKVPLFTFTASCNSAGFTAPATPTAVQLGCAAADNTVTGMHWNFGDPASGAANSSTLTAPGHTFSAPGTYTVKLVMTGLCTSDTVALPVQINGTPNLNVSGTFTVCSGSKATFTVTGAESYTWSGGTPGHTISFVPAVSVQTVTGSDIAGCTSTKEFSITILNCTGLDESALPENIVFPLIGNGHYTIRTEGNSKLSVFDAGGRLVLEKKIDNSQMNFDISGEPNGIYFIRLTGDSGTRQIKILKSD